MEAVPPTGLPGGDMSSTTGLGGWFYIAQEKSRYREEGLDVSLTGWKESLCHWWKSGC